MDRRGLPRLQAHRLDASDREPERRRVMGDLSRMFDSTPRAPDREKLAVAFDATAPAEKLPPVPTGEYPARWIGKGIDKSRKGNSFFFGRFELVGGEYDGRWLIARWYLTSKALARSKSELAVLGLASFADLESAILPGGYVLLRVALRCDDSGVKLNEVREVVPLGTDQPPPVTAQPQPPSTPQPDSSRAYSWDEVVPVGDGPQATDCAGVDQSDSVSPDQLPASLVDADLL